MNYPQILTLLMVLAASFQSINAAEILKAEEIKFGVIELIEFNDHTYIRYRCYWNHAADEFFHDPGCKCLEK